MHQLVRGRGRERWGERNYSFLGPYNVTKENNRIIEYCACLFMKGKDLNSAFRNNMFSDQSPKRSASSPKVKWAVKWNFHSVRILTFLTIIWTKIYIFLLEENVSEMLCVLYKTKNILAKITKFVSSPSTPLCKLR